MSYSEIEPNINELGEVRYPNLHDSKLLMIRSQEQDNNAIMEFKLCSGEVVQITFEGVTHLICNDFWMGNIVLDMTIETGCHVLTNRLEKAFIRPTAMFDRFNSLIKLTQEKIAKSELSYVELNPSCGCEGYILCKSVKFVKLPN